MVGLTYARVEAAKDKQIVDRYYAAKSPPFVVHHDPTGEFAKSFDATVYPIFVLVDKFGRGRYRGRLPHEEKLEEWTEALLAERADLGPDVPLFGASELDVPKLLAATKLPDLKGAVKSLREYMGPRGLLITFVDTTCPFSEIAVGDMPIVTGALARHRITTVLVNLDDEEEDVRHYFAKHRAATPILFDVTTTTKNLWNVQSVPTVALVDTDGKLLYMGKAVWRDIAVAGEKMLSLPTGSIKFSATGTEYG